MRFRTCCGRLLNPEMPWKGAGMINVLEAYNRLFAIDEAMRAIVYDHNARIWRVERSALSETALVIAQCLIDACESLEETPEGAILSGESDLYAMAQAMATAAPSLTVSTDDVAIVRSIFALIAPLEDCCPDAVKRRRDEGIIRAASISDALERLIEEVHVIARYCHDISPPYCRFTFWKEGETAMVGWVADVRQVADHLKAMHIDNPRRSDLTA